MSTTKVFYLDTTHHEILPLENIWHQQVASSVYNSVYSYFRKVFPTDILTIISNFIFPLRVAVQHTRTPGETHESIDWISA